MIFRLHRKNRKGLNKVLKYLEDNNFMYEVFDTKQYPNEKIVHIEIIEITDKYKSMLQTLYDIAAEYNFTKRAIKQRKKKRAPNRTDNYRW